MRCVLQERRKIEERRAHEAQIKVERDTQLAAAEKRRREAAEKKHKDEARMHIHHSCGTLHESLHHPLTLCFALSVRSWSCWRACRRS